ncbi:alpha/beta hydrolase family protein [Nocardia cyriacigeorgica]|uniref:alpha/beta hydrolase family protein n=1 Tax=Nocardia cyriacigeorgica TaxID=135487 RepID=UPI0018947DC2|nr:alpha/beta fold hydrolase [Nocardia cyriacigeorgica]MBF6456755.1 alpha/beta fold hydrolase [Nocardia cyriacigeorgica]MBF6481907.1 alpha/beta fold hydrolase [Nocardia cyriacigeorgica]MBF6551560.1 alpha/beta fold hydrolase [Nocardia cyriacigeorgica]
MRARRVAVLVLSMVAAMVLAGCSDDGSDSGSATENPVRGDWHGKIDVPGQPLEIGVDFLSADSATIDIPSQGVADVSLDDVVAEPDRVEFTIPDIPGDPAFHGRLDTGAGQITGDFTQSGQTFPLVMRPGALTPAARPQEPKPPFPYVSEDVSYPNGDITIAGTLTKPEGDGPFPAVLMLTGSGPQDRNEELFGHKPFLLLADTLTRAGYAVLRTDDRGVGGTSGDLDQATYDDLAGDAAAGVDYLRTRDDIDPARVGLLGHSEGGYLAPLVASKPDSGVAFAILMAGPAVPGGDVLIEQNRALFAAGGASPEETAAQVGYITALADAMRAGDLDKARQVAREHNQTLPEGQRMTDEQIDALLTPSMTSFMSYDPAPALSALRVPVLAFFGEKDLQVLPSQNEQPMRDLLAGDPDATVHTFPGLNHLMQPAGSGLPSEYSTIETTIAPEVLDYVKDWLTQRVPAN